MKFLHISDLHLGKRVNEFSIIEDQKYILSVILGVIDQQKTDGVIIAGDVYDKTVPSAEAVELFDDFLVRLVKKNQKVFVISGNHDSAERLAFGGRIMDASGVYFSPLYNGKVEPIKLTDEYGQVNLYLLPFVKPSNVRRFFEDVEINTYTDAMQVAIDQMNIDDSQRNVLVSHQFVTGAVRSDSEEVSVGGLDNVDGKVFEPFDYVALGHIHAPQNAYGEKVRYCGTPLKYSFSEVSHKKSVTMVELKEKGVVNICTIPLIPCRDMVEIRGSYDELTAKSFYEKTTYQNDYLHITLTDEEDITDVIGKLRVIYPNVMKIDYDNKRTRENANIDGLTSVENKSPLELFAELFKMQNNRELNEEETEYVTELIKEIWEVE